jgi:hypothetical protein
MLIHSPLILAVHTQYMPVFPVHAQLMLILSDTNYLPSLHSIHIYQIPVHPRHILILSILDHPILAPSFLPYPLRVRMRPCFHPRVCLPASESDLSSTHTPTNNRFRALIMGATATILSLQCLKLPTILPTLWLRPPRLKFRTPCRSIKTPMSSRRDMGPTFHRGLTRVPLPPIMTISLISACLDLGRS